MTTEAEAIEFYELSQRRALRRFLDVPEVPSGFGALPGRGPLIQIPDFDEESTDV